MQCPCVLSPAPQSGDAQEAGKGAQLVRLRASWHHACVAAAPHHGPHLAAARNKACIRKYLVSATFTWPGHQASPQPPTSASFRLDLDQVWEGRS